MTNTHPFQNRNNYIRDFNRSYDLYDEMLQEIVGILNELHDLSISVKSWEIIIGPFLWTFIQVYIEKSYYKINDKYNSNKLIIPNTTADFITLCKNNEIKQFLSIKQEKTVEFEYGKAENYSNSIISKIVKAILETKKIKKVVFYCHHFKKCQMLMLSIQIRKIIIPFKVYDLDISRDLSKRIRLIEKIKKKNKEIWFALAYCIPKIFIEEFTSIYNSYSKVSKVSSIYSSTGWYSTDYFKIFSAVQGSCLIGEQHGGNYGITQLNPLLKHELSITDHFISWGKKGIGTNNFGGIRVLNSKRLIKQKRHIVFISTGKVRNLERFDNFTNYDYENYKEQQFNFICNLDVIVQNKLIFVDYPVDYHWEIDSKIQSITNIIHFERNSSLLKLISNSKLVIIDHLSTSYAESLINNKPTILILDKEIDPIFPNAEKDFLLLEKAGILFRDVKMAIIVVNDLVINDCIDDWWNDPQRRIIVNNFRENYINNFSLTEYKKLFRNIND